MMARNVFLFLAFITGCINGNVPTLLKRAARAYNYEDYRKTIESLSEYLMESVDDGSDDTRYFRAVAFYYRGQARRGLLNAVDYRMISDFEESLKYRVCVSHVDRQLEHTIEHAIIDDYTAALSLQPNFFYASFHLGLEQLINGELSKAENAFACAWKAIPLDSYMKEHKRLWVPTEVRDYKRFIAYYYGMLLLRNENSCNLGMLRDVSVLLAHEAGMFKAASALFDNVIAGKLTCQERMDIFNKWHSEQIGEIMDRYFKIMNAKRIALNKANAKRFLNHYRAKHFRFIVELTDAYLRYDLKKMTMESGDNFLIMRSLNDDQILAVKHAAVENGFTEWHQMKDSASWQLYGLYGKQKVVVFNGSQDLPVEYCVKNVAFNEKAVLLYSLNKNVLYCVVVKNLSKGE